MGITIILSREDYERFAEEHPELKQELEDANFHGVKFKASKDKKQKKSGGE